VPPAFGGGAPLPATIQFTEKGPLGDTQEIGAWLIDETDMGFYILRAKDAKKAMFIPRRYVRAIYFGNEILQESNGHDPRNDGR